MILLEQFKHDPPPPCWEAKVIGDLYRWSFPIVRGLLCLFVGPSSLSVVELIATYKAVPSTKSLTLDLTCSGRSFMYTRKRIEPRREPCGNYVRHFWVGAGLEW